jgi:hypothetical protein
MEDTLDRLSEKYQLTRFEIELFAIYRYITEIEHYLTMNHIGYSIQKQTKHVHIYSYKEFIEKLQSMVRLLYSIYSENYIELTVNYRIMIANIYRKYCDICKIDNISIKIDINNCDIFDTLFQKMSTI